MTRKGKVMSEDKQTENFKLKALSKHLEYEQEVVKTFVEDGTLQTPEDSIYGYFETADGTYQVLTDNEADDVWDEQLDQYIDDCVLDQLPNHLACYFDDEKFKRDCKFDGRGHTLSPYDGTEHEYMVEGEWFYIYRID